MKRSKSAVRGRSFTGKHTFSASGQSTAVVTEMLVPRLSNLGQSGIAIGLSLYKPANGRAVRGGKIAPTASTERYKGKVCTSLALSRESAQALYKALGEMLYD